MPNAPHPSDYTPGRPIQRPSDLQHELQRVSIATRLRVRLRGLFTTYTAAQMRPPPQPGDMWIEFDPATGTTLAIVQISVQPRFRSEWEVEVKKA